MIGQVQTKHRKRLTLIEGPANHIERSFAQAVKEGLSLTQKAVPSRYFYDQRGSELFEEITELPEYYLTRAEQSILELSSLEIVRSLDTPLSIVEFGGGSSKKTRLLIEAALRSQPVLSYTTLDISAEFIQGASKQLLETYPELRVTAIAAEYFAGIGLLPDAALPNLLLFMGSNIGNFEDAEAASFLTAVSNRMDTRDGFLLGFDLAKDPSIIEPAYNDSKGITAAFNKNLLVRINRELGGHFDLASFDHKAPYLPELGRVEMRLESKKRQTVAIDGLELNVNFEEGEYIHTENSRKFSERNLNELIRLAGLEVDNCWFDSKGWFGLFILRHRSR